MRKNFKGDIEKISDDCYVGEITEYKVKSIGNTFDECYSNLTGALLCAIKDDLETPHLIKAVTYEKVKIDFELREA